MRKIKIAKKPVLFFTLALMQLCVFGSVCIAADEMPTADANSPAEKTDGNVFIIPVEGPIMYDIETSAFEEVISSAAQEKPKLILLEIDTPGGRIDFAKRMCTAIQEVKDCDVIAYVKSGEYGGAISAGAAVALSCDKIYMAKNTVIGAATLVTLSKTSEQERKKQEKSYKEVIDEKYSSVWRAYLASLAQKNNRPGLLARAMVDNSIEVIEVNEASKRLFIDPVNKKPDQQIVRTWNKSGSLVTLTAEEAVDCGIADGLAESQDELLQKLGAGNANIEVDEKIASASREMQIVQRRVDTIEKSIDLIDKKFQYRMTAGNALSLMRKARKDFETLKTLAEKYPDLNIDIKEVEEVLNSINAAYEDALRQVRRRH
jgi:membrane-bound ClpP family serine protease